MSEPTSALETEAGDELLAELADDFVRRYRAGERPSVDEYADKHPALAARIRELFPAALVLEEQSDAGKTLDLSRATERVGTIVGRYKLLEQIGEGGFGVVYMAEQMQPVRRKVALKVIKPGMDTRQVVARFEAERQALALMDHENIAKVLDAGTTDSGRPYFVMELVRGVPITEFCDANHLTTRERLELFVPVCQAVQHAHNKGIIHRDLKPTNVLVTVHDTTPIIKVIDFGVAKALGQEMTDKTLFTGFAEMIGTPLYMSPEQAGQSGLDIDTRSDIYSLGVLLYELLTGTTPFTKERFKQAACDEIRRIICEEEPPKPSTRLSDLSRVELVPLPSPSSLASISALRHTEPAKLTKLMRGELDWIVMKALEKDRNRRYETATGFAADLQRYLADEPVQACPPSTAYRLKKFVRRNKGAMLAASLVLLTLVAGIVGTTWQAVRAEQARQAEAERAEGERLAKERAEANFALAREAVEKYLGTVTDDPDLKRDDFNLLRRKLLESAIPFFQKIAAQKSESPEVQAARAQAYGRLGFVHGALGEYEADKQDFEEMRAIYTSLSKEFPNVSSYQHGLASSEHNLAISLNKLGMHAEAEAGYRRALVIMERLAADFPTGALREDLAKCYRDLGVLFTGVGNWSEAEAAYRRAIDIQEQLADEFPETPECRAVQATYYFNLGIVFVKLGKSAEAEAAIQRSIDIHDELAAKFPTALDLVRDHAVPLANLGDLLTRLERYEEAEASLLCAVEIQEKFVARFPSSPEYRFVLADCQNNLGVLYARTREDDKSAAALQRALGIQERLVADFPKVPEYRQRQCQSLDSLGNVLKYLGKPVEAEAAYRKALEINEKLVTDYGMIPDYAVGLGGMYCNFGDHLRESGQPEASLEWFEKAISRLEAVLAKEPRLYTAREFLRNSYGLRAIALDALGRRDDAIKSREEALALNKRLYGPSHIDTIRSMNGLINDYVAVGRFEDSLKLLQEMLTMRQQAFGPDDPETLGATANVAVGYFQLGRLEEALKLREEVLPLMKAKIPEHAYTLITMSNLANSYAVAGRHKDALKLYEEVLELRKTKNGPDDPETLLSMHELAESLIACDRGAEAIPLIDDCIELAAGKSVAPSFVPSVFDLRLRYFEKQKDASRCRTTAEMWERLNRDDAESLYSAACYRAVTAAVLRATDDSDGTEKPSAPEADRAMEWMAKAVAGGFSDIQRIEKDERLSVLRDREDFKEILAK